MKKVSVEEIIEKHIEYDKIIEQNLYGGDHRKNNRAVKNKKKLVLSFKDNTEIVNQVYDHLLSHSNSRVRAEAAIECLRLRVFEERALRILEELAADKGMLAFSCSMCLRIWRGEIAGAEFEHY